METNPAGDIRPAEAAKKTWKDYIGWAGFVVTAGVLLQQIIIHGDGLWYLIFGEGVKYLCVLGDPAYSFLYHLTTVFDLLTVAFFTLFPALVLVLMLFRKKAVPGLLVVFAAAAIFTNTVGQVLYTLLAAEGNKAYPITLTDVVYLLIDIALVFFYVKSKRFRALFIK